MRDIEIKLDEKGYADYNERFIGNQYENKATRLVLDLPACYVGKDYFQYAVFTLPNSETIVRQIVKCKCIIDNDITKLSGVVSLQIVIKNIENADNLSDGLVIYSQPISCYIKPACYNPDDINDSSIDENVKLLLDEFDALLAEIRTADARFKAITDASSNMTEVIDARGGYTVLKNRLDMMLKIINDNSKSIGNNSDDIKSLLAKITSLASGTPLPVSSVSEMVNTSRVYVNTSDGNWYYYNDTNWVIGGVYQASGIGDKTVDYHNLSDLLLDTLNLSLNDLTLTFHQGTILGEDGVESESTFRIITDFIMLNSDLIYKPSAGYRLRIFSYTQDYQYLTSTDLLDTSGIFSVNPNLLYRVLICKTNDATITVEECNNVKLSEITNKGYNAELKNMSDVSKVVLGVSTEDVIPTYEVGTIDGTTGEDKDSTNRIRTDFFKLQNFVHIKIEDKYKLWIFKYDDNYNYLERTSVENTNDFIGRCDPNAYYRIALAHNNDSDVINETYGEMMIKIETYSINTELLDDRIDTVVGAELRQSSELMMSFNTGSFSTDDYNSYSSGMCLVKDVLLCFGVSDDEHLYYAKALGFNVNLKDKTATLKKTITHNLGHVNTIDYCEENDCLIFGNGSGDFELLGKFYVYPNFYKRYSNTDNLIVDINDCIEYDCSLLEFGNEYKYNACWGDGNRGNHDVIILVTNNFRTIRKIQLGKGANQLDYGVFNENAGNDEFNGTFKIQNTYTQDTYSATGTDNTYCVQDMDYQSGKLYAGVGHGIRSYWIMALNTDGSITRDERQFDAYNLDGTPANCTAGSICCNDDYLIINNEKVCIYRR